jgi:hypothetical protein
MKRELIFEDVQDKVLGILGVPVDKRKTIINEEEEENEEPMGAPEEAGEEMENETPEEENEEEEAEGDVDLEGMSYEDKMSLVLEIIDSFEDDEEQKKFVEELKEELNNSDDSDFE